MDARSSFSHKLYNRPKNTPARALWAFCAAMLIITTLSTNLHKQNRFTEVVTYPTALGETKKLFTLVRPIAWDQAVATLADGTPLYLQSDEKVLMRDSIMLKVHFYRNRYHVYRPASEADGGTTFYLKIGKSEYVRLGLSTQIEPEI